MTFSGNVDMSQRTDYNILVIPVKRSKSKILYSLKKLLCYVTYSDILFFQYTTVNELISEGLLSLGATVLVMLG